MRGEGREREKGTDRQRRREGAGLEATTYIKKAGKKKKEINSLIHCSSLVFYLILQKYLIYYIYDDDRTFSL